MSVLIFQTQSVLIVALMLLGLYHIKKAKKDISKHIRTMKFAMLWDIALILQIELTRDAIAKASKIMSNSYLLNIHVSLALSTVLLYIFVFRTGQKVANGQRSLLKKHKFFGILTLITRIATLITSFFIL